MSDDLRYIVSHWPAAAWPLSIRPLPRSPNSFSGAQLWRVDVARASYALRRWPERQTERELAEIHTIQSHLASGAPDIVPALARTSAKATALVLPKTTSSGRRESEFWDLSAWMPGDEIAREQATPDRMAAAMRALARVHNAAVQPASPRLRTECPWIWNVRDQYAKQHRHPLRSLSSAMHTRVAAIRGLADELQTISPWWERNFPAEVADVNNAMAWIYRAAVRLNPIVAPWADIELPLEARHGDAHLGNFLFIGHEVTGLLDYGAVGIDSLAGDVGRLIGTLVGDNPDRRKAALEEYQSVRRLSELELAAVDIFDHTGVIVAADRWIQRLTPGLELEIPALREIRPQVDRGSAYSRLRQLVSRLRLIAGQWTP